MTDKPNNCVICGNSKSFLAATEELCLVCFDTLQRKDPAAMATQVGKTIALVHELELEIKRLLKEQADAGNSEEY